jgi:dihydrodipicolinate synthase/N-acetylneuraminate lyase
MAGTDMRGVFTILVTPFDDQGRIDYESLAAVTEFDVAA